MALLASKPGPYATAVCRMQFDDTKFLACVNIPTGHLYNQFLSETLQHELGKFNPTIHMNRPGPLSQTKLDGEFEHGQWICLQIATPQDYKKVLEIVSGFFQLRAELEQLRAKL